LHRAGRFGSLDALHILKCWAREAEANPNELLLAQHDKVIVASNWKRRKSI
jgi:hypothetical protein